MFDTDPWLCHCCGRPACLYDQLQHKPTLSRITEFLLAFKHSKRTLIAAKVPAGAFAAVGGQQVQTHQHDKVPNMYICIHWATISCWHCPIWLFLRDLASFSNNSELLYYRIFQPGNEYFHVSEGRCKVAAQSQFSCNEHGDSVETVLVDLSMQCDALETW